MPKVSIIILTYNSSNYIVNLLKSIISLKEEAELIVVDNASTDETLNLVKSFQNSMQGRLATNPEHAVRTSNKFSLRSAGLGLKVDKVLELPKNVGFAAGINTGAKSASGENLLFLNPDTIFESGRIRDMIEIFKIKKSVGIVGGKMIDTYGNPEKSAGKFFNLPETLLLVLGLDEVFGVRYSPKKLQKVDFVSGGFMMVKKDLFEKLRGFDEKFFMYVEDMELCYRASKIGFSTYFTPDAVVSHKGQGSSNRSFAILYIYKGILYFYKKHKSKLEFETAKFMLKSKALSIYMLGRIINNSYYTQAYKKALTEINNL